MSELPASWEGTLLDEVTLRVDKVQPKDDPKKEIRYLDISGIDNRSNKVVEAKTYLGANAPSRARQLVYEGDVLFSTVRTYLKNIAKVPSEFDGEVASTGFAILRPSSGILSEYLFLFSQTPMLLESLAALQRGSSYPAVRDQDVRSQKFPLPPLNEQKRIVAKIEELFSELDAGEESLRRARRQLGVYRQSLLQQAFSGRLTARWREENPSQLEDPETLLARIQQEREARYAEQIQKWEGAVKEWEADGKEGKKPTKPRKTKDGNSLIGLKLASPIILPSGWTWIGVTDVGRIETGTTPSTKDSKNYGGNIPFFKPTDLEQGINVREAREHLSSKGSKAARILPAGTTLITCIGATIGKTGLATVPCATNQQINTISPEACFDPRFVYYAAIAPRLNGLIKSEASATTLPILNKSKFESLPFPLTSLPEQNEIVRLLDEQFTVIEQNEREIDAALKRSEALRQSILKKAFTGQLVEQDPADEPASVLLDRIRQERAEAEAAAKAAKKKASAKKKAPKKKTARKKRSTANPTLFDL